MHQPDSTFVLTYTSQTTRVASLTILPYYSASTRYSFLVLHTFCVPLTPPFYAYLLYNLSRGHDRHDRHGYVIMLP